MADNKEYFVQTLEQGTVQISEDVIATTAANAVLEVEGVCGLNGSLSKDIAEMLGKKLLSKGVRISTNKEGALMIECDLIAKVGYPVFELAKNVQESVKTSIESVTGLTVGRVNVNVTGIALPRESKK